MNVNVKKTIRIQNAILEDCKGTPKRIEEIAQGSEEEGNKEGSEEEVGNAILKDC